MRLSPNAVRALARLRSQDGKSPLVCPAGAPDSNRRTDWDHVRALVKLDRYSAKRKGSVKPAFETPVATFQTIQ